MDKKEEYVRDNAGVFRRCLNGFFQSNFFRDNNIEALKLAIEIEDLILKSNYKIDYYTTQDGRILRANKILPMPEDWEQKITIKKKFSSFLSKLEIPEIAEIIEVKKDVNYFRGKLAYNEKLKDIGIITGYFPNNNKSKMRFSVKYAKNLKGNDNIVTLGLTAWNEDVCEVFNTIEELYSYIQIQSTEKSLIDKGDSIIKNLEEKLNFLGLK